MPTYVIEGPHHCFPYTTAIKICSLRTLDGQIHKFINWLSPYCQDFCENTEVLTYLLTYLLTY